VERVFRKGVRGIWSPRKVSGIVDVGYVITAYSGWPAAITHFSTCNWNSYHSKLRFGWAVAVLPGWVRTTIKNTTQRGQLAQFDAITEGAAPRKPFRGSNLNFPEDRPPEDDAGQLLFLPKTRQANRDRQDGETNFTSLITSDLQFVHQVASSGNSPSAWRFGSVVICSAHTLAFRNQVPPRSLTTPHNRATRDRTIGIPKSS